MDEFVAENILGWFKKINKRKSFCILLVVYIFVLMTHGHTNIKFSVHIYCSFEICVKKFKTSFGFTSTLKQSSHSGAIVAL